MDVVLLLLVIVGITLIVVPRLQRRRSRTRRRRAAGRGRARRAAAPARATTPVATWTPPQGPAGEWDDDLGWEGVETAPAAAAPEQERAPDREAWERWRAEQATSAEEEPAAGDALPSVARWREQHAAGAPAEGWEDDDGLGWEGEPAAPSGHGAGPVVWSGSAGDTATPASPVGWSGDGTTPVVWTAGDAVAAPARPDGEYSVRVDAEGGR